LGWCCAAGGKADGESLKLRHDSGNGEKRATKAQTSAKTIKKKKKKSENKYCLAYLQML
jgi:hypothetical protein